MASKAELLALALRCEAATGPDRELERAIKAALEGRVYVSFEDDLANRNGATPPRYTASLDAAMSLVPEGFEFGAGSRDATNNAWAWCGGDLEQAEIANAGSPALALTAASLKARAAMEGEDGARA